ncbi:MAG: hypothetical protein NT002_12130 [candidate division Zixibacteria bacterium]|nr:hypothetical protein [candidate division Zixibacteria bacterium]
MASKCVNCGKDLSLWGKMLGGNNALCPQCKIERQGRIDQYLAKLCEFGSDNYLSLEEGRRLDDLQKALGLQESDLAEADRTLKNLREVTKKADIGEYERKLDQMGEDGLLTDQEEKELSDLLVQLRLENADIEHTFGKFMHLKRLTAIRAGNLPVLMADILLKKNEQCHYEIRCELAEEKRRTRYEGGTRGISLRVAKGLYYRVGGFKGERIVDTSNEVSDQGTLYLTNKRIIFVGTKKSVTYPIDKIVNFTKFTNAIQFQKENEAKPKYFLIKDEFVADEIGMILSKIAQ